MVLAGGFWCFAAGCHVKSPLYPNPLSNTGVLHDGRKHTRPSSFHNPTLSANKHVVQICRSTLSVAVQTVQVERRASPFNGIERSLSRAVVIKTRSLPVSATTFPTALSLYIAHDGRKHKHKLTDDGVDAETSLSLSLCISISLLRPYTFFSRSPLVFKTLFDKHKPKLSANKHVVQICRSLLSAAADGPADCPIQVSVEPRLSRAMHKSGNGIERSLSRVVVPPSLPVSAATFRTVLSLYIAQGRLRKDIRPLSKLFTKAEPLPFEKEINVNLVYFSCFKHVNKMVLGDPRQTHQRTQTFRFPSSFINHSTMLLERSSASSLFLHALEHSTGSECVNAFGLRAIEVIICMITRDFSLISIDVTGISLSLPLSLSLSLSLSTTHKSHSPHVQGPNSIRCPL